LIGALLPLPIGSKEKGIAMTEHVQPRFAPLRGLCAAALAAAPIALCLSLPTAAQEVDDGYLTALRKFTQPDRKPVSVGVPSGFGASGGRIFGSVAYTNHDRNTGVANDNDGSIAFGIGLGDPTNGLGFELVVGITSVSTAYWGDGNFGDEGNVSIKLHQSIGGLPGATSASIAFGVGNLGGWGSTQDLPRNYYLSYSQVSDMTLAGQVYPFNATLGYGSAISGVDRDPGAFASIGFGLTEQASMGLGWLGDELHIGAVYFPTLWKSASIAVTYADATQRHSEGGRLIVAFSLALEPWRK
jgi:hypothetical protein